MNGKNKVALSGAIAAIVAVVLIAASAMTPGLLTPITSSTLANTTTQLQSTGGGSGTLAVLMTDPPTIPSGVTAVYINYSDVQIHVGDAGNKSGWTDLHSNGSINLMSVINSTQTIASAKISSGVFNALRFNITSAVVTFEGKNYSADLIYQEHTLFVPIAGGIAISDGKTAAAVIDMTPTVLLLGTPADPTFAFMPAAKGYTLPAQSVSPHPRDGDRDDYKGKIQEEIHDNTHFEISAVVLTPSSLSITVQNTGSATVIFRFAALTSTSSVSGGWVPSYSIGSVSKISEFFVIAPNSSLLALDSSTHAGMVQTLALSGYALAPKSSVTFTYNGPITIGALTLLQGQTPTQQINPGQRYVVTVLGSGLYAQTLVTAGSGTTTTSSSSTSMTTSSTTSSTSSSSSSSTTSTTTTSSSTSSTTSESEGS